MKISIARKVEAIGTKLGRCPRCMKTSFLVAAAAWALALAIASMPTPQPIGILVWVVSAACTMLWIGHLAAFATRAKRGAFRKAGDEARIRGKSAAAMVRWPRRRFVLTFAKTFLVAALATSFPLKLMAQSCSCSEPDCTCPPDAPNCFINPALQESFCCGYEDTGCASPLLSWCCPNGTNCYGDNGECY